MSKAIVLFSGGIDSTACLYWAKQKYSKIILLSFLYNSKEDQVIQSTNKYFSALLSIESKIISLPFLGEFGLDSKSSLIKSLSDPPEIKDFSQLNDKNLTLETAKKVWIPGRNILFLSIAASLADSLKQPVDIVFGGNKEEGQTFPDNTLEFVNKMNQAISLGCVNEVSIKSPFSDSVKGDIVSFLIEKKAPLDYTSSCYIVKTWSDDRKPIHCGKCESCQRRKRAFQDTKNSDPTIYDSF
jgi:7-cyano-7-deazaguanine synthase